ncbi:MAG: PCP reductase family protein [Planctomycetes bacterium]|nr:PCP reductase family protein [Planctomycetota bacterium]
MWSVSTWVRAGLLFLLAIGIRLAFVHATIDSVWPYSVGFEGDAIVYWNQAHALINGLPVEHGLPLRPPGTGYVMSWLWDGNPNIEGTGFLRLFWIALGASVAPVLYLTGRGALGDRIATIAGAFTALATGPLLLSATLCSETPYLVLATATAGLLASVRRTWHAAVWAVLCGVACLFRSEHLAHFGLGVVWLLWRKTVDWKAAALLVAAFVTPLVPWQVKVWQSVTDLNETVRITPRYTMGWTAEAKARIDKLPAFARASSVAMIQDAAKLRGAARVDISHLDILEQAFDYTPERLPRMPFVSVYGPMNFYLANDPTSHGKFSRDALFAKPPLHGGAEKFPQGLRESLPTDLSLSYPPHIRILEHGYGMRLRAMFDDPLSWLRLVGQKLAGAWAGAAHGLGGYAFPLGLSGTRDPVDLVVPGGSGAIAWQLLWLALAAGGIAFGWRKPGVQAWLLMGLGRLAVIVLFFGYARQGALLAPTLGVLLGVVLDRVWSRGVAIGALLAVLGLCTAELIRFRSAPQLWIDDTQITTTDPFALKYERRAIHYR